MVCWNRGHGAGSCTALGPISNGDVRVQNLARRIGGRDLDYDGTQFQGYDRGKNSDFARRDVWQADGPHGDVLAVDRDPGVGAGQPRHGYHAVHDYGGVQWLGNAQEQGELGLQGNCDGLAELGAISVRGRNLNDVVSQGNDDPRAVHAVVINGGQCIADLHQGSRLGLTVHHQDFARHDAVVFWSPHV